VRTLYQLWFDDLTDGAEGRGTTNRLGNDDPSPFSEGLHEKRNDFDDGANALWSLYGKEAKGYDEAWVQKLKDDMDGVLLYVCAHLHPIVAIQP
jgi:hypothetical protein